MFESIKSINDAVERTSLARNDRLRARFGLYRRMSRGGSTIVPKGEYDEYYGIFPDGEDDGPSGREYRIPIKREPGMWVSTGRMSEDNLEGVYARTSDQEQDLETYGDELYLKKTAMEAAKAPHSVRRMTGGLLPGPVERMNRVAARAVHRTGEVIASRSTPSHDSDEEM